MTGPRRNTPEETLLHANCVAIGGKGVLILGPPGTGKSDLTLRLIDAAGFGIGEKLLKAELVSDDQVRVRVRGRKLIASPPTKIAGLLEIRGLGIVRVPYRRSIALALAVRLTPAMEINRMPEKLEQLEILGISLPLIRVDPVTASAPARLRAALAAVAKQARSGHSPPPVA